MNKWLVWARVLTLFVFMAPFVFVIVYIVYVLWQVFSGGADSGAITGT